MTASLSDDARAIAGGLFGLDSPVRLSVRFEKPRAISPQAAAALAELVDAGMVECKVTASAVTYTQLVDCREHYHWLRSVMHKGIGRFAISTESQDDR